MHNAISGIRNTPANIFAEIIPIKINAVFSSSGTFSIKVKKRPATVRIIKIPNIPPTKSTQTWSEIANAAKIESTENAMSIISTDNDGCPKSTKNAN